MTAFYLDENVSERLVELLGVLGHDVVTADGLGHKGRVDADQLLNATLLGRVLITHDRGHFQGLHEAWLSWLHAWDAQQYRHAGIIVVHSGTGVTNAEIATGIDGGTRRETRPLSNRLLGWGRARGWFEFRDRS